MGSNPPRSSWLEDELAALRAESAGPEPYIRPFTPRPTVGPPTAPPRDQGFLDEALARLRGVGGPDIFGEVAAPVPTPEEPIGLDKLNEQTEREIRVGAEHVRNTQGPDAVEPYVYAQHANKYGKRAADILHAARQHGMERLRDGASREEAESAAEDLARKHIANLESQVASGVQTRDAEEATAAYEGLIQSFTTPKGLARTALTTGLPMVVGLGVASIPGAGPILTAGAISGTTALAEATAQKFLDDRPVNWREASAAGVTNILEVPALQVARGVGAGIASPLARRAVTTAATAGAEAVEEAGQLIVQEAIQNARLPSGPAVAGEAIAGALVGGPVGGAFPGVDHPIERARQEAVDGAAAETESATPLPQRPAAEVPAASLQAQLDEIDSSLGAARNAGDILAIQSLEQARQEILDQQQKGMSTPVAAEPPQPGVAGPVTVPGAPPPAAAPLAAGPAITPTLPGAPLPGPGVGVSVTPGVPVPPVAPGELSPVEAAQQRAAAARPTVQGLIEAAQAQNAGTPPPGISAATPIGTAPPELGILGGPAAGAAPSITTTPILPGAAVAPALPTAPPVAPAAPGATFQPPLAAGAPPVAPGAVTPGGIAVQPSLAPRGRITLGLRGGNWIAAHEGPVADEVMEAFGTTELPTPFTREANPEEIRSELQRLNPDVEVVVEGRPAEAPAEAQAPAGLEPAPATRPAARQAVAVGQRVASGARRGTALELVEVEGRPRARVLFDEGFEQYVDVDKLSSEPEPAPTPAQIEAGNYRKGHRDFQGLDISVETAKGGVRRAKDGSWEVRDFPADYGYVKRTEGADGEQVDVYVGDDAAAQNVFVVDQVDADTGRFDEHKAMLGFPDQASALEAYRRGFSDGRAEERIGAVTPMPVDAFKAWLKEGDTTKPVGELAKRPAAGARPIKRVEPTPGMRAAFGEFGAVAPPPAAARAAGPAAAPTPPTMTKGPVRPQISELGEVRRKAMETALDRIQDKKTRVAARRHVEEQMWRRFLVEQRQADYDHFGRQVDPVTGQKIKNRAVKRRAAKDALANAQAIYGAGWETIRGTTKDPAVVKRLRQLVEGKGLPTGAAREELPLTTYAYSGVKGWIDHVAALPLGEAVAKVQEYSAAHAQTDEDVYDSLQRLAADVDSMGEDAIRQVVDLPGVGRAKIAKALAKGPEDPLFKRMLEYRRKAQAEDRAFQELLHEYADQAFEHPALLTIADNLEEDLEAGLESADHPLLKTFMWGINDPATGKQATADAVIEAMRFGKGRLFSRIRTAYTDAMSVMQNDVPFEIPEGAEVEGFLEAPRTREGQDLIPGFMEAVIGTAQKPIARKGEPAPDFADAALFTQDEARAAREEAERLKRQRASQRSLLEAPKLPSLVSLPQDNLVGRYGPPPRKATAEQLAARQRWADLLKGEVSGLPAPGVAAERGPAQGEAAAAARGPAARGAGAAVGEGAPGGRRGGGRGPGVPAGVQGAAGVPGAGARPAARAGIFHIVNPREAESLERPAKLGLIPPELAQHLSEDQAVGVAKAIEAFDAGSGFLFEDGTGVGKTRELLALAHTFLKKGNKVLIVSKAGSIEPKKIAGRLVPSGSYRDDSAAMGIPIEYVTERGKPLKSGVVNLGTYHALRDYAVDGDTVLLLDEAHQLKSAGDSEVAAAGADLIRRVRVAGFATATPGDKPYHMSYLASIGFFEGKDPETAMKDLGVSIRKQKRVSKVLLKRNLAAGMDRVAAREAATETIDVWKTTSPRKMRRALDALFRRLTRTGTVIKREVDLSPIQVVTHKVMLPEEAHRVMDRIEQGNFDRKNALMHMRRQQEPYKLQATQKLVMEELAAGRQVVVFATRVNQSEVREKIRDERGDIIGERVIAESEGTLKQLAEWLKAEGIPTAEIHGAADERSEDAQARFQRGEAKVVIASYEKGGTGINLDDRSGAAPRSMILMTSPFDSVSLVQALGRIHRFTTRSKSRIHILFSDHGLDAWNGGILAGKLKMLHALVSGDIAALDLAGMGGDEETLNAGAVHYVDAARVLAQFTPAGRAMAVKSPRQWGAIIHSLKRMGVDIKMREGGEFSVQTHEGFEISGNIAKGFVPELGERLRGRAYGNLTWNHDESAAEFREAARAAEPPPPAIATDAALRLMREIGPTSGAQRDVKPIVSFRQYEFMKRRLEEAGAIWGEAQPGAWQIGTRTGEFLTGELVPPRGTDRGFAMPKEDHGAFYWLSVGEEALKAPAPDPLSVNAALDDFAQGQERSSDPDSEVRAVAGIVGSPVAEVISYERPHLDWRKPARLGTGVSLATGRELGAGIRVAATALREGFQKLGKIDFDGQYVGSLENAAAIFQTARNPSLEHAAIFFVDRAGVIRGSMQTSSQSPSFVSWGPTTPLVRNIEGRIAAFAQQGVEIAGIISLHNHPSGNALPSDPDLTHSGKLAQALGKRYMGAAIVDHEQATVVRPNGTHYMIRRAAGGFVDPDPFLQEGIDSAAYYNEQSPYRLRSQKDVRSFAESILGSGLWRKDSTDVSVMFVDRQNRLALMTLVPRPLFNSPGSFRRFVVLVGKVSGADSVFAAGPGILQDNRSSTAANVHMGDGVLQDVFDLGTSKSLVDTLLSASSYHGRPDLPWQELLGVPNFEAGQHLAEPPVSALPEWGKPDPDWWARRVRFAELRTQSRMAEASAGVDPRAFWDAFVLGVDAIRRGARSFSAWLKGLVAKVPWAGRYGRELWDYIGGLGAPIEFQRTGQVQPFAQALETTVPEVRAYKGPIRPIPKVTPQDMLAVADAIVRGEAGAPIDVAGGKPIGVGKSRDFPINIHQISDEGQIKNVVARGARALSDRLGVARQKYTMPELHTMALELGYSEADWHRMVREKGALTAPEIIFGRVLRQHAGVDFGNRWEAWREAQEHAKEKGLDPEEQERRRQEVLNAEREKLLALHKFIGMMYGTAAAAAEAGRALRAHNMLAQMLTPEERFLQRLFRGRRGDEKAMAELVEALRANDMERAGRLIRKIHKPGILRMIIEYYINSLLSAPSTSIANVAGNLVHEAALRTPERAIAARLEQFGIRQGLEQLLRGEAKPTERVVGQAMEALRAQVRLGFGMPAALNNTLLALRREDIKFMRSLKGEFYPPAIPGVLGKVVRTPGRVMEGLDLAARQSAMSAEQAAQLWFRAYQDAHKNGWKISSPDFEERLRELHEIMGQWILLEEQRLADPTSFQSEYGADGYKFLYRHRDLAAIYEDMRHAGDVSTFRDATTKFSSLIKALRNAYPALSFAIPFVHTTERLLVQGFRRTPLGLAKTVYNISKGSIEGGEASDRLAQGMLGTMLTAAVYVWAKNGFITGGAPEDPRDRENWLKTGKLPYAVRVGKTWYSYARIEPLATTFGLAADLAAVDDQKVAGDAFDKLHYSVLNQTLNKTYLEGLINAAEAIGDPDRYAGRFWKRMLGAAVPNLLAAGARAIDPTIRETDSISQTLMARVPMLSTTLPPRLTGTGEPVIRGENAPSRFLSPVRYAEEAGPEKNLERIFLEAGYSPSQPPRTITLPGTFGRKVDLTPAERRIYAGYSQRATAFARTLTTNNDWSALDAFAKRELLERIYRFAHDAARREMLLSVTRRLQQGKAEVKTK